MHKGKTLTVVEAYLKNPIEIVMMKQFKLHNRSHQMQGQKKNDFHKNIILTTGNMTVQNECQ